MLQVMSVLLNAVSIDSSETVLKTRKVSSRPFQTRHEGVLWARMVLFAQIYSRTDMSCPFMFVCLFEESFDCVFVALQSAIESRKSLKI